MGTHPIIDAFRETVGQPSVVKFDKVEERITGHDIVFMPKIQQYGISMFAYRMYVDGEEWNPDGEGHREVRVKKLWYVYDFYNVSGVVLELIDEWGGAGYEHTFEVDSFSLWEGDIENLYDMIEATYE